MHLHSHLTKVKTSQNLLTAKLYSKCAGGEYSLAHFHTCTLNQMSTPEINNWLKAGIVALKAGKTEEARAILTQLLSVDERNEKAWLLLSRTVKVREERQLCLENALAINPDSQLARKGLRKLGIDPNTAQPQLDEDDSLDEETAVFDPPAPPKTNVRREREPLSAAAAILYPERQVTEWEWTDPTPDQEVNKVGYTAKTQYEDVWSQDIDICAFCATPVTVEDARCPTCKNNLIINHFTYPKPSQNLVIFWVLLLGLAQINLLQIIYNIIFISNPIAAIWNGVLLLAFGVLSTAVYFRQFWAFIATHYLLAAIFISSILQYLIPTDITASLFATFDPSMVNFLSGVTGGFGSFLKIFQLATAGIALFYAFVRVSSDFERTKMYRFAAVGKRLEYAADYHINAQRAAKEGLWATAVLHWQRAAAKEPNQIKYQRHLANAYSQLRFYKRAIDVLQSARARITHAGTQAELDQIIQATQQKLTEMTDLPT